jgi:hypothetical protein
MRAPASYQPPCSTFYKDINMKKMARLFIAFFVSVNFAWAQGTMDDLQHIRKLTQEKKYPEALAAHQQFFEASRSSSGMGGVRLSFALYDWIDLGNAYPPAMDALNDLSASHRKIILAGKSDFGIFHEYKAINEILGKNKETIETFVQVETKFPKQAEHYYLVMKDTLVQEEQLDVVARNANDPIYEFEKIRYSREQSLSEMRKNKKLYDLVFINAQFNKDVKTLIDVTAKIGMKDEAEEIERRAETYMKGNLLRKYH